MQLSFNSEKPSIASAHIKKCVKTTSFAESGRVPRQPRPSILWRGRLPDDFPSPIQDASDGYPAETSRLPDNAGPRTRQRRLGYPSSDCPVGEQARLPVTSLGRPPVTSASSPSFPARRCMLRQVQVFRISTMASQKPCGHACPRCHGFVE